MYHVQLRNQQQHSAIWSRYKWTNQTGLSWCSWCNDGKAFYRNFRRWIKRPCYATDVPIGEMANSSNTGRDNWSYSTKYGNPGRHHKTEDKMNRWTMAAGNPEERKTRRLKTVVELVRTRNQSIQSKNSTIVARGQEVVGLLLWKLDCPNSCRKSRRHREKTWTDRPSNKSAWPA